MAKSSRYTRVKGGEKNEKSGQDWTSSELVEVCNLYIELHGKNIHENNPQIHELAQRLNRTVRSVENQLLGFRAVDTNETGRKNYNSLIPQIWAKANLKFRISSALKDIIGRDLITDDNVAIFELVKNAFDAYATKVDIHFENIYTDHPRILIIDNGKGMNYNDLINKWLFVAYSAKREGTEDENFDYRDLIYTNRPFAGAKAIGRFSCDRLGKYLYLETLKKEKNSKIEVLRTEWEKFEGNLKEEFVDINIIHQTKENSNFGISHGTVLEITGLRSLWNREKLLKLRDSLAKLINPNRGIGENNFRIFIHVPEEEEEDINHEEDYKIVNGEVKNFIFETLQLKTTKIHSSISEDGKEIITELRDGGTLIYKIKEINKFNLLKSVDYTLYYLNMSAKLTFTRHMGLSSRNYGHIFLYRNGFRVYPYGEPGEDPLKIDVRHAQGTRRYLGTRDLIGQIEIFYDSEELKETSSRGDGLIKTPTYYQLEDCFWETLRKLEKYVVEVQRWGFSIEDGDSNLESNLIDLISKLSDSDSIIEFETPSNFIEILKSSQDKSATAVINNLRSIAIATGDEKLLEQADNASLILKELRAAKEEAELQAEIARDAMEKAEREAAEKESENLFLRSVKSQDFDEIVSFLHHIGLSAGIVDNYLSGVFTRLQAGKLISTEQLIEIIKIVLFENKKIQNISKFATKANFKLYTDAIDLDLNQYLKEYINNIVSLSTNEKIKIIFKDYAGPFIRKFRPIEINILVDNLLSNSKKASAENFIVETKITENNNFNIIFKDDGRGIEQEKLEKIFGYGYTTSTKGSGIGLYHIKEIVERMGGTILAESILKEGTTFIITLHEEN